MNTQSTQNTTSAPESAGFSAYNAEKAISFIRQHDPKTVVAEGYRLAVVRYRDTSGKAAKPAKQVVIPQVQLPSYITVNDVCDPIASDDYYKAQAVLATKAREVIIGVLEDAQDSIIRSLIDADLSLIEWDSISADKCLEFLTAARVSERLTKERIEAWVPVAMGDVLDARSREICQQKQYAKDSPEWTKQHAGTRNAYVSAFAKLAAAVPNIKQNEAQALEALLDKTVQVMKDGEPVTLGNPQDDIAKALRKKLNAILRPVILENSDL